MSERELDMLVIGGGIVGAGSALGAGGPGLTTIVEGRARGSSPTTAAARRNARIL